MIFNIFFFNSIIWPPPTPNFFLVEILFSTPGDSWYEAKKKYLGWFWPLQELLNNEKNYVHKKSGHFFWTPKLANFVLQRVRHIILGQNKQIKKICIFTVWPPEWKKSRKILKFRVFPHLGGAKGGLIIIDHLLIYD